jgi:TIR domain
MDPLWITYAWSDDEEGDFSYLIQELKGAGIAATYDNISLVPGRRLWEQIAQRITESPLSGWAYLVTPNSLESEACREELAYALCRALTDKGKAFPLIGLLHEVQIEDIPAALAVRLCISLASPTWKEEVLAGLEGRPPKRAEEPQSRYVWGIHNNYRGNAAHAAVEVRPRFGTMMFWRFVIPVSHRVIEWGWGPAGGGALSSTRSTVIEGGSTQVEGVNCTFFGAGDALSPSVSAYVVFERQLPEFLCFGQAEEPFGGPGEVEIVRP